MKYIFVAGAPGSKWSSVTKNIYYSASIDRSDYSEARTYWHDAPGELHLMHIGAYFDPGMEFGQGFDQLEHMTRDECEAEFDRPFSGQGIRIIKSHVFCHHIDFLRCNWPESPVITVYRDNDACLGWWVKCGHFDITYPLYHDYYRDLKTMAKIIADQNRDLRTWTDSQSGGDLRDNLELCRRLGIDAPPQEYRQDYDRQNIRVRVFQ